MSVKRVSLLPDIIDATRDAGIF